MNNIHHFVIHSYIKESSVIENANKLIYRVYEFVFLQDFSLSLHFWSIIYYRILKQKSLNALILFQVAYISYLVYSKNIKIQIFLCHLTQWYLFFMFTNQSLPYFVARAIKWKMNNHYSMKYVQFVLFCRVI